MILDDVADPPPCIPLQKFHSFGETGVVGCWSLEIPFGSRPSSDVLPQGQELELSPYDTSLRPFTSDGLTVEGETFRALFHSPLDHRDFYHFYLGPLLPCTSRKGCRGGSGGPCDPSGGDIERGVRSTEKRGREECLLLQRWEVFL